MANGSIQSDPRNSVYAVQNMLLAISRADEAVARVNPTGVYGDETADSVRSSQRARGLPVTGETDQTTFEVMSEEYLLLLRQIEQSTAIRPFERALVGGVLSPGERLDLVLILQVILDTLSADIDEILVTSMDGEYNEETRKNVETFQRLHGLPVTGTVDRRTWDRLADSYNASPNRRS